MSIEEKICRKENVWTGSVDFLSLGLDQIDDFRFHFQYRH